MKRGKRKKRRTRERKGKKEKKNKKARKKDACLFGLRNEGFVSNGKREREEGRCCISLTTPSLPPLSLLFLFSFNESMDRARIKS